MQIQEELSYSYSRNPHWRTQKSSKRNQNPEEPKSKRKRKQSQEVPSCTDTRNPEVRNTKAKTGNQEPAARIRQGLLQRHQLGEREPALRGRQGTVTRGDRRPMWFQTVKSFPGMDRFSSVFILYWRPNCSWVEHLVVVWPILSNMLLRVC